MRKSDKVLSCLEDEQSRFIYRELVKYRETGNFDLIRNIVDRYLPALKDRGYYPGSDARMLDQLKNKKRIIIFGSGANGSAVAKRLISHGIPILCFVDNDRNKWGKHKEEIEIRSLRDINLDDVDAVIVTPYERVFIDEIHKQLFGLGAGKEKILDYRDYCPAMLEKEQYFDPDIIRLQEREIFVDGGVLNLETSLRFLEECAREHVRDCRIYAFEPDRKSYDRCKEILKEMPDKDIRLYNAGLWSEDTTLYFSERGNGGSRITQNKTDTFIHTVHLDSCISEDVTFIKMDIEGAEMEALRGSCETIRRCRPKLAICIYHKKEDLTDIPLYIKELVPEYRLYIRHYSDSLDETVLYAVI